MASETTPPAFPRNTGRSVSIPVRPTRLPLGNTRRRISYERRLRIWLTALALPALFFEVALVYRGSRSVALTLGAVLAFTMLWSIATLYLFDQLVRPLQTLSNVVAALREDDFSFRARGARRGDSLGDLALEINALAGTLQSQRSSARDALGLLERVMGSMPSPVFAFGPDNRLRLINQAAERSFGLPPRAALGRTAAELGLEPLRDVQDEALFSSANVPSGSQPALQFDDGPAGSTDPTRWSVRRSSFRLNGIPHTLLVLSDVAAALREEERRAWQRLIRVLSHEINNSLAPIHSIAGSLRSRFDALEPPPVPHSLDRSAEVDLPSPAIAAAADHVPVLRAAALRRSADLSRDALRGLGIIEERAASLNRFLQAYQQLTRLPPPRLQRVPLARLLEQVVALETRVPVTVAPGPPVLLTADPDQLQQLLINLIRNAADAALSPDASTPSVPDVSITWNATRSEVHLRVSDNGTGLINPANLFVPFYTTKPNGSGIGLALARQIAAAHRASLTLTNRTDGVSGCVAELHLVAEPG